MASGVDHHDDAAAPPSYSLHDPMAQTDKQQPPHAGNPNSAIYDSVPFSYAPPAASPAAAAAAPAAAERVTAAATPAPALDEARPRAPTGRVAVVARSQWVPDRSRSTCTSCNAHFTLLRRRHHCRLCGGLFCHGCSLNRSERFPDVRTCDFCLRKLKIRTDLQALPYYHGSLQRPDAELLLKGADSRPRDFLLRESGSVVGALVIDYVDDDGGVRHLLISEDSERKLYRLTLSKTAGWLSLEGLLVEIGVRRFVLAPFMPSTPGQSCHICRISVAPSELFCSGCGVRARSSPGDRDRAAALAAKLAGREPPAPATTAPAASASPSPVSAAPAWTGSGAATAPTIAAAGSAGAAAAAAGGASASATASAPPAPAAVSCIQCSELLPLDSLFCYNCGFKRKM